MLKFLCLLLQVLALPFLVNAFIAPVTKSSFQLGRQSTVDSSSSLSSSSLYSTTTKLTLDEQTTWRLRFILDGIPSEKGKMISGKIFAMDVHFVEEIGYEPPQGDLKQILATVVDENNTKNKENQNEEESSLSSPDASQFKITSSRWQLSEDPTDRKDGLWIWGLFQEPLYPFLLLQLETTAISLPGEDDSIPPLKLFAQIDHKRDKEQGVLLSGAELKIRVMETMKADPFGAANVEIYEEVRVGQLSVLPIQ